MKMIKEGVKVKIYLTNSLYFDLDDISVYMLDRLKKYFRVKSPEYLKSDNKRAFNNKDKYILMYSIKNNKMFLPRGCSTELFDLLSDEIDREKIELVDKRLKFDEIDFPLLKLQLYKHQKNIVEIGSRVSQGTVQAGCGSGKTIALIALIARCRQPALVIVPNDTTLLNQWIKNIEDAFNIKYGDRNDYIGIIGDGKYDYKNKHIVIAMTQSIYSHRNDKELINSFGFVCMDECFYKNTKITMADGSYKNISNIKKGDKILNLNVIDIVDKLVVNKVSLNRLVLLKLNNGKEILTTLDHRFLVNGRWVECFKLNEGDILYGDKNVHKMWKNVQCKRWYWRVMRIVQVCGYKVQILWKILCGNFNRLRKGSWSKILFSTMFGCGFNRKEAYYPNKNIDKRKISKISQFGKRKNGCNKKFFAYERTQSYDEARKYRQNDTDKNTKWYLWLDWFKGWKWKLYSATNKTLYLVKREIWKQNNIGIFYWIGKAYAWVSNKLQSGLRASKIQAWHRSRWCKSFYKKWDSTRFKKEQKAKPIRVESLTFYKQRYRRERFNGYISDKEKHSGYIEMYDLTIRNKHNYFANGVLVHNCHMVGARTFRQSIHLFPAYYRFGVTATLFRNDNLGTFIEDYCGKCFKRITDDELRKNNLLLIPKMYKRNTSFKFNVNYNYRNWYNTLIKYLMRNKPRNMLIVNDIIKKSLKLNRLALVISTRVNHCILIAQELQKKVPNIKIGILIGEEIKNANLDYSNIITYDVEYKAKNGELDVIFGVDKVKQGLDIPPIEDVYIIAPRKSQVDVTQIVGRSMRPDTCFGKYKNKSDKEPRIYDYVDVNIDVLLNQYNEWRLPIYQDRCEVVKTNNRKRKNRYE